MDIIKKTKEKAEEKIKDIESRNRSRLISYSWLSEAGEDVEKTISKADERLRRNALLTIIAAGIIMIAAFLASGSGRVPAKALERAPYGGNEKNVTAIVSVEDKDWEPREIGLTVLPRILKQEEAELLFDECEKWLRETILPETIVTGDLSLPLLSSDGLVNISWQSSDPLRISEEGLTDHLELPENCYVRLTAILSAGEHSRSLDFPLKVTDGEDDKTGTSLRISADRAIDRLSAELSASEEGEKLVLPSEYRGLKLFWSFPGKEVPSAILPLCLFVLLFLYFSRFDAAEKRLVQKQRQIEDEVPSLTLQLVLYLNAGLAVSSALTETAEKNRDKEHPLYKALASICDRCTALNQPFSRELALFARKSGCRNFIRITSIIADNEAKGSELAQKLDSERTRLWAERLSGAKSKAAKADTKLCFPLMLLLAALVIIAAAPAFMEMQM